MDFDEVISHVGELGRYQKWLFALLCVPTSVFSAVAIYNHIFISAVVEHHCHLPVSAEKASLLQKSLAPTEDYKKVLASLAIPRDADGSFVRCEQYDIDVNSVIDQVVRQNKEVNSSVIQDYVAQNRWPKVQCLNNWDYDTWEYTETLATKFHVVCDQEWLTSTAQSTFFVGGVIGSIVIGWMSDRWGRKPALCLAILIMTGGSLAQIYPPTYFSYIIMRFIVGLSYPSVYNQAFLIVIEMIGPSKRMAASMGCQVAFAFGMMLFAYVAHFTDDWQTLQVISAVPMLPLFAYYWTVPESPRWLVSQRRVDEAEIVVQKMAKANNVPLTPNFLQSNLGAQAPSIGQDKAKVGFSHFFKYPRVLLKMFAVSAVWSMTALVYHGMSFAVPDMPSDTYFAFFLSGLSEFPAIIFVWWAMSRFGRRSLMFGSLFLSGVLSSGTAFVPDALPWLSVLLPSLAKLTASTTFIIMYIYAGEIFPTVVRGFAMGFASTMSQFGMIICPYILFLGNLYGRTVPFLVLGVLSGLAALVMLFLPETLNAPLPTTMQDAEDYTSYVRAKRNEANLTVVAKTESPTEA